MNKSEFRVERGPVPEPEPFAIGMAKLLEREGRTVAAELRRLHAECEHHKAWVAHITAENKSLEAQRDALLAALKNIDKEFSKHGRQHWPEAVKARAAIAKAEEKA